LDLGYAICNLYRTTQSNSAVVRSMLNYGDSTQFIAVWTYGAVQYLCPQYLYLLP
jgi:hypothetical protein